MHASIARALAISALTLAVSLVSHAKAPNVLVVLADDIGWGDAGCYGATKIQTPHIDRLAREGRRFDNAYASASVCTPTRYSLLTGEYAWRRWRFRHLPHPGFVSFIRQVARAGVR